MLNSKRENCTNESYDRTINHMIDKNKIIATSKKCIFIKTEIDKNGKKYIGNQEDTKNELKII